MANLAPSPENYMYGKGELYFRPAGNSGGFEHLGNAPSFEVSVELEKTEHYSSMAGIKEKDQSFVNQKSAKGSMTLEEFTAGNLARAVLAEDAYESVQVSGTISAQALQIKPDLFVPVGKTNLSVTKLRIANASASFAVGETVTGATSGATGKVAYATSELIELVASTGTYTAGEQVDGGTSKAKGTVTGADVAADIIMTDAANPKVRYEQGKDYDVNVIAGLVRVFSAGAIKAGSAFITADYAQTREQIIDALTATAIEGELLFVGNPAKGPIWKVEGWKVSLTVSGGIGFISDEVATLPMEIEFLSDRANHPTSPFFRATRLK